MKPAFSSARQAAAFALLLLLLLLLPLLPAGTIRRDVYAPIPWKHGTFPWMAHKIFDETNTADIVFAGSSHLWTGINPPHVQQKLREQLGREPDVFTLSYAWAGYDALYFIARDLLEHRPVRLLVIYDEDTGDDQPHRNSFRWFRPEEDGAALAGLPWRGRAGLYGAAVLGRPRQLLSAARPNLLHDFARTNYLNTSYHAPNLAGQRGGLRMPVGFDHREEFVPYTPPAGATPAEAVIYADATRGLFSFSARPSSPYQLHFARKLARLCQERGTRLVALHLPEFSELNQATIPERGMWSELLGAPVDLVGLPAAKLFAGVPAAELHKLFSNSDHLNQNGQDLFTPLITPALLKLHASTTNRF